ncbi:hypothetical protein CYMTET_29126, partial [Cymbomonas tetramitiformis]
MDADDRRPTPAETNAGDDDVDDERLALTAMTAEADDADDRRPTPAERNAGDDDVDDEDDRRPALAGAAQAHEWEDRAAPGARGRMAAVAGPPACLQVLTAADAVGRPVLQSPAKTQPMHHDAHVRTLPPLLPGAMPPLPATAPLWRRACRVAHQVLAAVVVIQAAVRKWQGRRRLQGLCSAAVVIQAAERRHRAQLRYDGLRRAAITVQRSARRAQWQRRARNTAAVTLQGAARRWLAERTAEAGRDTERAVIVIQRHVRGRMRRRDLGLKRAAAVCIQLAIRARLRRAALDRSAAAALQLQRHTRGWQQRRRYHEYRKIREKSAGILQAA